jgi:hypothetical protein
VIDWDALLHAPVMGVFGEAARVTYSIAGAPAITVDGIFDEGSTAIDALAQPGVLALQPRLGIRLSQFPPDFEPRNARGDTFVARGRTYVVTKGDPDGKGWAILEAKRQ